MTFRKNALASAICLAMLSSPLSAQEQEEQEGLEVIEVTSQKRVQSIKDVPLSVAAVTGDFIKDSNLPRLDGLAEFIPNVNITDGFTGTTLNIRGIGTAQSLNSGFEQSVATFIDGVYAGRDLQSLTPFLDLERVEVLRGPQPAYFGQNAIGGALNIATKKPTMDEFNGFVTATVANEGEVVFEGAVDTAVSDGVGIRIAGRWSEYDGFMTNTLTGEDTATRDQQALRFTALFEPTSGLEIVFKYETAEQNQFGSPSQIVDCDPDNAIIVLPIGGFTSCGLALDTFGSQVEYNGDTGTAEAGTLLPTGATNNASELQTQEDAVETDVALLAIEYDLGGVVFNSNTAFSGYDSYRYRDIDGTPLALVSAHLREDFEQFSQELRLTSTDNSDFEWMVGAYYQTTEIDYQVRTYNTIGMLLGAPGASAEGASYEEEGTWLSAFTALTFHVSDSFRINGALRYSEVEKDGLHAYISATTSGDFSGDITTSEFTKTDDTCANGAAGFIADTCAADEFTTDAFTYALSGQWDINKKTMAYISFSHGFKAGGFNGDNGVASAEEGFGAFVYDDEEADAWEAGIKSRLLDNTLDINLALFHTKYDNLQVSSFEISDDVNSTGAFNITNAGEATTQGLELDGKYLLTDGLIATLSFALLDASYDRYDNGQCSQLEQFLEQNGCSATVATTDRAGYELLSSPEYSGSLGFQYESEVGDSLLLTLAGNVYFSDDYQVSDRYDPRGEVDSYTSSSLTVKIGDVDGVWSVSLFGRDLEDTNNQVTFGPSQFGGWQAGFLVLERGASYGLQVNYNFQ